MRVKSNLKAGGDITVYGADWCPHCKNQKQYFDSKGIDYKFVDCDKDGCPDFVSSLPTIVATGFTEF